MVVIRSKHLEDPRRGYRNCTQHRKDPPAGGTSAGTTRASSVSGSSLRAGNATSSQSKRNDSCIHGSMTLRAPLCWRPLRPTRALVAAAGWPVSTKPDRGMEPYGAALDRERRRSPRDMDNYRRAIRRACEAVAVRAGRSTSINDYERLALYLWAARNDFVTAM
jgi:hypothetical protein